MRVCARTGCRQRPVASCAFNYDSRLVWIQPLLREPDPSFYALCETHVDGMRVPRGWSLEDRRGLVALEQPSLLG